MKNIICYLFLLFLLPFKIFAQNDDYKICISSPPVNYSSEADTLMLTTGKPVAIFFMIHCQGSQNVAYGKNKLEENWLALREWNELQSQYPDVERIFLNRYTVIITPNENEPNVRLLNLDDGNYGYIFWSGEEKENCLITESEFIQFVEWIARIRGESKISSYITRFESDIENIERIKTLFSPSEEVKKNIRYIPLEKVDGMMYIPLHYLNLDGVSKITAVTEEGDNRVDLYFNPDSTLWKAYSYSKEESQDSILYVYKNGLPEKSINMYGDISEFRYHNDTVFSVGKHEITAYVLIDKVFVKQAIYRIQKNCNMLYKNIETKQAVISRKGNELYACFDNKTYVYSNTRQELPVTFMDISRSNNGVREEEMTLMQYWHSNDEGNIHVTHSRKMKYNNDLNYSEEWNYAVEDERIKSIDIKRKGRTRTLYFYYNE